jgi:hypothetical protein
MRANPLVLVVERSGAEMTFELSMPE